MTFNSIQFCQAMASDKRFAITVLQHSGWTAAD